MQVKNGRKPVRLNKPAPIVADDIFQNPLGVDEDLKSLLESKGFAIRFINHKQYADFGGSHPAHWKPISKKKLKELGYDTMDVHDFSNGSDVDGYIRRGDLVLAVRSKEINEKHNQYLRQEADRVSSQHTDSAQSAELSEFTQRNGLGSSARVMSKEEVYEDEK